MMGLLQNTTYILQQPLARLRKFLLRDQISLDSSVFY
jgi:hypothetical protein